MPKNNLEKRTQIIEMAEHFFFTKGYENTSVNDIINAANTSKGGFYHHFNSKQAVLMSVVKGLVEQSQASIRPIFDNKELSPLEKIKQGSNTLNSWKIGKRDQMMAIMKVLHSDGNLHFRHQLAVESSRVSVPMWAQILSEGVTEGIFDLGSIEDIHAAEFIFNLLNNATDSFIQLLFDPERPAHAADLAIEKFKSVEVAIERMLGATTGSLQLIDAADIATWFE